VVTALKIGTGSQEHISITERFPFVPDLASPDTPVPYRHNLLGQQWYFEEHWEVESTQE